MSVILITGANGQLGNEIRTVSKNYYGYDFVFTDLDTLDITDAGSTLSYIKNLRPEWIINCAAYNLVDEAEEEPIKAMAVNSAAVGNIAEAVKGSDSKFIHISSDYVFSGTDYTPYNENSLTGPINEYGRSKLAGEKAAMTHHGSMIIRTSWLYSAHGSNFVKTILTKSRENNTLRVVFDQTGTPTYAFDLAEAIMTIVAGVIRNQVAFNSGIYHFSNEGVCSWYDFAVAIVEEAGVNCKVIPVLSGEYRSIAKRPFYSVLDKSKIKENYGLQIPHWRSSLEKCINQINKL